MLEGAGSKGYDGALRETGASEKGPTGYVPGGAFVEPAPRWTNADLLSAQGDGHVIDGSGNKIGYVFFGEYRGLDGTRVKADSVIDVTADGKGLLFTRDRRLLHARLDQGAAEVDLGPTAAP